MMLEESIQALLAPLATSGAFQDVAAQGTVAPYIVWQQIASTINNSTAGASNVQNTRLQVDCYATSQSARRTLSAAVIAAMAASTLKNVQLSSQNLFEPEAKLFRTILEFSIWSA